MTSLPEPITVSLGERSYPIHIVPGGVQMLDHLLAPQLTGRTTIVITDANVAPHWLDHVEDRLGRIARVGKSVVLPAGEETKSFRQLESLLEQLLEQKTDRKTVLIALGGGVIGDLVGVAASLLLRGVPFIQIPTSLLAMVDSSVGGKTGINTPQGKNLVGSFYQPQAVVIDPAVLTTLPDREWRSGYAEIVKYGCIDRPDFFAWLETSHTALFAQDRQVLAKAIRTCCEAKAAIVAADERESSKRALLNLGHTFGHALEKETGYGDTLLHGEAVALGIILAARLSAALGLCPEQDVERISTHFAESGLPVRLGQIAAAWETDRLLAHMQHDKKMDDGRLTFVLLHGIGQAFLSNNVPEPTLRHLIDQAVA